jgi:DNA modification methylase
MTPYYQEGGITIYHGDCREVLSRIGQVDAIVSDPPYGIAHV